MGPKSSSRSPSRRFRSVAASARERTAKGHSRRTPSAPLLAPQIGLICPPNTDVLPLIFDFQGHVKADQS